MKGGGYFASYSFKMVIVSVHYVGNGAWLGVKLERGLTHFTFIHMFHSGTFNFHA